MARASRPELKLDWCSYEAAKYAVEHWHYSRVMPPGKTAKIGCWEAGTFIGAVVFSLGANNHIASPFGVNRWQVCELARVALTEHLTPVSRIVPISVKLLQRQSPGLRLIVSYADPARNHHGGVYQAMGWCYVGNSTPQRELVVAGQFMHKRSASSRWGTRAILELGRRSGLPVSYGPLEWKHKYLYPLDSEMRQQILPLSQPYPKRAKDSNEPPAVHAGEGGAAPTRTLHNPFPLQERLKALSHAR